MIGIRILGMKRDIACLFGSEKEKSENEECVVGTEYYLPLCSHAASRDAGGAES